MLLYYTKFCLYKLIFDIVSIIYYGTKINIILKKYCKIEEYNKVENNVNKTCNTYNDITIRTVKKWKYKELYHNLHSWLY